MADEDFDALAAEYVLGTLTADERAGAEQLAAKDAGFAGRIAGWERRLGNLEAMVDPVEPPPEIWNHIRDRIVGIKPHAGLRLPEVAAAAAARDGEGAKVTVLTRRLRRWRGVAALAGAIAAALLIIAGLGRYRPDLLPPQLQPPVQTKVVEKVVERVVEKVVEVPAPPSPVGRFVAVLQRDAGAPAFLLTVDVDKRSLTVRRVTQTAEAGKSYELWLVSDKFPSPRSLGLVGSDEFTQRPTLASYDEDTINSATYAVSLEPEGGSPTGSPTGPVLFAGKLVEAVPPPPPRQ
jgi:anti-sigma-K factor RskA